MSDEKMCTMCKGATAGYKCSMCGSEASEHDTSHEKDGHDCIPKCAACDEAQTKCTCPNSETAS